MIEGLYSCLFQLSFPFLMTKHDPQFPLFWVMQAFLSLVQHLERFRGLRYRLV